MSTALETTRKKEDGEDTDADNSDGELKIVIESPARKKRLKLEIDEDEITLVESVAGNIEKSIEEKAARSNFNVNNVKKLLKQVVTNEHVIALMKQYEHPEEHDDSLAVFEPKLTRAKAKELYSSPAAPTTMNSPVITWASSQPSSEVQALISDELQEDSSGDEYVPESEDEPLSVQSIPPTTPTRDTTGTQTNWSEDGVFKLPPTAETELENANIALRTRSKLSLSSTPLEVIERAFMPPDITTDMYDMDCDDDDWADFLKTFTKPLDEVTKAPDDEDHDPEYNILADEEIDLVDKEELREDKAVRIPRKELTNLMAELLEFADTYDLREKEGRLREGFVDQVIPLPSATHIPRQFEGLSDDSGVHQDSTKQSSSSVTGSPIKRKTKIKCESEEGGHNLLAPEHIPLLEQQLRQHVQMLAQSYLLTFQHPSLSDYAPQIREFLLNFKYLAECKERSFFKTVNLEGALELIGNWEQKFVKNDVEAEEVVSHYKKTTADAFHAKLSGRHYVLTFPEPLLRTVSSSEVFLYPHLLPRIPFYSPNTFHNSHSFNASEIQLIALGLEEFVPHLQKDRANRTKGGEANLKLVARDVHRYVLGGVSTDTKVYMTIVKMKNARTEQNPINYYFRNKRAPPTVHHVMPLNDYGVLPPCKRPAHMLPHQWKNYIYKEEERQQQQPAPALIYQGSPTTAVIQVVNVQAPVPFFAAQNSSPTERLVLPKEPIAATPRRSVGQQPAWRKRNVIRRYYSHIFRRKFAAIVGKAAPLGKLVAVKHRLLDAREACSNCRSWKSQRIIDMLPSMPSLLMDTAAEVQTGSGEFNCDQEVPPQKDAGGGNDSGGSDLLVKLSPFLNIGKTSSSVISGLTDAARDMPSTSAGTSDGATLQPRITSVKDNMDEINAFMKASSKIRKEPSGAEKKRIRMKREFLNNLRMVTPQRQEDINKHYENFALSYYKKLQEVLNQDDYNKVIEILVNVDESRTDAVDIYNQIIQILQPKYKDLAEEFLIFLNDVQALTVGKLVPYYMIKNMLLFLQKVDVYFQDKPSQAKKIFSTLTELGDCEDISVDMLKSRILPLLKGNAYLADLFLQNFITEHTPDSLIVDKFETIDITKGVTEEDEMYESIVIPDTEDNYGNQICVCSCHEDTTDPESSIRKKHCIPCGTRYLQGKIFIQTGKGLRPATVRFLTRSMKEQKLRLSEEPSQTKKRSESTSKRSTSPIKECHDESRVCKKKEDEGGGKKKTRAKSPKKVTKKPTKSKPVRKVSNTRQKNSPSGCDKKADNLGVNSVNKSNRLSRTKSSKDTISSRSGKSKRASERVAGSSTDRATLSEKTTARPKEKAIRTSEKVTRSSEKSVSSKEKTSSPSGKSSTLNEKTGSPSGKSSTLKETISSPSTKTSSPSEKTSSPNEKASSSSENIGSPNVPEPSKLSGASSQKRSADEPLEFDLNMSAESAVDLKLSSAESESEFCEESSQANTASDPEDSSSSSVVFEEIIEDTDEVTITSDSPWTREEDKTILETFRRESNKDNVFETISKCLPNRSIYQIKSRFQMLMSLIQRMTSEAEET